MDKEIWERQRQERAEEDRARERQDREEREQRAAARELEEEAARKEERKKHKSKYATTKRRTASTMDENAVVQTIDKDGNSAWVPAVASRGAKAALDDRDLTWEQLLIAMPRFLDAIQAAQWTEQRQSMTTDLFTRLQAHPFRASRDPLDRVALLRYLSEQRRLWHQAIEAGSAAWDIGILNEHLIRSASDDVNKEQRDRDEAERARREAERTRIVSGVMNMLRGAY
ncbi:hypothetical protein C0992_005892 [Termitomyces sp. T32_za158]|nr:hypothetical protein C0992_005892 [Termitomyces sp. T32_za158]